MPAIELITRPDLNTAFPVPAGAASVPSAAGAAPPGLQFGDFLSNSISSTPAFGPPESKPSGSAPIDNPQFGNAHFGGTQFGSTQSGAGQSANALSGFTHSRNSHPAKTKPSATQSSSTQDVAAQSPDGNATPAGDGQSPQSPNADSAAAPPAGNGAAADQPSLLAASVTGANHAAGKQSSPNNSAGSSTANAGEVANDLAPRVGAAPAQLVNSLLQADIANSNTPDASTNGSTQDAQSQGSENSGKVNAPQALIASLQQAVQLTDAQAIRASAGQSIPGISASDPSQNPSPKADNGPAPQLPAPAAVESNAAAVDAGKLVSLIQSSTTSSTAETPLVASGAIASGGNSSGKKRTSPAAAANVASVPQVALPATADGSDNSQTSPQLDANSTSGAPGSPQLAGQQIGNQQPGAVTFVGNSFTENATGQSAAIPATSAVSLPVTAQVSTSALPDATAISAMNALTAGNPAQSTTAHDASQTAPSQGAPDAGYLLFGAAPPSLQLHVTNFPAGQTAPSAALSSLVIDQAAYAVQFSHANSQQMQLHLNPPELGALQVDVSMHNGVLSARIEAQTPAAQQILTDNIAQLKDSLTQQGVSFDRIDVHLAGSNTGSGGSGTADTSLTQQQDGGLPWDQQFLQPESDDAVPRAPVPVVSTSRIPLTTLDIMI